MKINNYKKLAKNKLREQALDIVNVGLEAIDTKNIIKSHIKITSRGLWVGARRYSLKKINRIFVVGVGKCSVDAGEALEEVLGDKISGGIVFDVRTSKKLKIIKSYGGDHPFPSDKNIGETLKIIKLLNSLGRHDLVITVVSGGGSTLLCQPDTMTCHEEKSIVEALFKSGASIYEINTIRKHISLARGGFLAKYAYPARVISLIFSDVPGDKKEFIASGPTMLDTTSIKDAEKIVKKYNLTKKFNISKINFIETPKEKKYFRRVTNKIIVSNKTALKAMSKKAKLLGFYPKICNTCFVGEAKGFGKAVVYELENLALRKAILYGGETTVTITGKGVGGRNQEVVLSALKNIKEGEIIIALASDGIDNTDHAGALADVETLRSAQKMGLNIDEYLKNNDSYTFFSKIGDFLDTGYTGSNVSDLVLALKK